MINLEWKEKHLVWNMKESHVLKPDFELIRYLFQKDLEWIWNSVVKDKPAKVVVEFMTDNDELCNDNGVQYK